MLSKGGEWGQPEPHERKEVIESILNKRDQEVIDRGLAKLYEMLDVTPDHELPSIILFPDTSARPLVYAVKPVISALYKQKGLKEPEYRFVVTHSGPEELSRMFPDEFLEEYQADYLREKEEVLEQVLHESNQELTEELDRPSVGSQYSQDSGSDQRIKELKRSIEYTQNEISNLPKKVEKMVMSWNLLFDRLDEIVGQNYEANILVIDDYLSKGASLGMMNYAILSSRKDVYGKYFVFCATVSGLDTTAQKNISVNYGVSTGDAGFKDYGGFSYRTLNLGFVEPEVAAAKKQQIFEPFIGVRKNIGDKYSSRSPEANKQSMRRLRQEMKARGELLASELREQEYNIKKSLKEANIKSL